VQRERGPLAIARQARAVASARNHSKPRSALANGSPLMSKRAWWMSDDPSLTGSWRARPINVEKELDVAGQVRG